MSRLGLFAALVSSLYLLLATSPLDSRLLNPAFLDQPGLTISGNLQAFAEKELNNGLKQNSAEQGAIIIMNAKDGSIKAVASAANPEVCKNLVVCRDAENLAFKDWQPGSVMKPLILAAAINEGKVTPKSTFYDSGSVIIRDRTIQNATYMSYGKVDMQEVITTSINTGAVYLMTKLGNNQLDDKARDTWHNYLVNKYKFSQAKSLAGNMEEPGYVRPPSGGRDLDFRYAGSSFGIGVTVAPTRLVAAYAALINGGIYHEPRLVKSDQITSERVVSEATSMTMAKILESAAAKGFVGKKLPNAYEFGGKTGTAPLPDGSGFYRRKNDSGTFIGFVGSRAELYVVFVRLDAPVTEHFASYTARDLWFEIVNKLAEDDIFSTVEP